MTPSVAENYSSYFRIERTNYTEQSPSWEANS